MTWPSAVGLALVIAFGCSKQVLLDQPDSGGTIDAAVAFDAGAADSFPEDLCGNGVLDDGEACDDNNLDPLDGCSRLCQVECNGMCASCTPGACVGTAICGDGIRAGFETCDDGNSAAGDGCTATCAVEDGWDCPLAGRPCAPICGDGKVRGPETCDDRNDTSGDGCSAACLTEPTDAQCGNGIVEGAEACDPPLGVLVPYTCLASCRYAHYCGDGELDPGEECDLGVANNTGVYGQNACTPGCMRTHYCGDGILDPGEPCDFGAANGSSTTLCSKSCYILLP